MTNSDWREKALAAVARTEQKRRLQTTRWGSQFHIRLTPTFKSLLRLAAESRGITIVGYVRRAVAKQVAKDLELDWDEVLIHSPYPAAYGEILPDDAHRLYVKRERRDGVVLSVLESVPDDGTGFGDWS